MDMQSRAKDRKSLRLRNYDYSSPGAYSITICSQDKRCLFGEIHEGVMRRSAAGQMLLLWYQQLPEKFSDIQTDAVVVMPNHMHFIIVGADPRVRPSENDAKNLDDQKAMEYMASSLFTVMQWFKTMTTNDYIHGVNQHSWPRFNGKLWQRNYYEHVIRSEASLQAVREYIANNPAQWHLDRENPANVSGNP